MKTIQFSFALFYFIIIQSIRNGFKKLPSYLSYKIKSAFYQVVNIRKILKFRKFEKLIQKAQAIEFEKTEELMKAIKERILSYYPKGRSLYIPLSLREKREIRAAIYFEYGEQMEKHKIKINKDLKFV
jgi:hypothetical protein